MEAASETNRGARNASVTAARDASNILPMSECEFGGGKERCARTGRTTTVARETERRMRRTRLDGQGRILAPRDVSVGLGRFGVLKKDINYPRRGPDYY